MDSRGSREETDQHCGYHSCPGGLDLGSRGRDIKKSTDSVYISQVESAIFYERWNQKCGKGKNQG